MNACKTAKETDRARDELQMNWNNREIKSQMRRKERKKANHYLMALFLLLRSSHLILVVPWIPISFIRRSFPCV